MAGYRLPGTRIEEVTQPKTVNLTTSQRIPCFIGIASDYIAVDYEEVTRSSSGLADGLEFTSKGIYEITQVGSQRGLNDYTEGTHFNLTGDQIVWTSAGVIDAGATYYVSYKYDRPYDADNLTDTDLNDYRYKEFTNYEDVVADLGEDIPDHPLVNIAKLALLVYNVPIIATVQVKTESQTTYTNALNLIKYRNVQDVIPMTTDSNIRSLVINHVTERSLPDNGRYRIGWFGAATGTEVGTESDASSLRGIAVSILNERAIFVNATRAKYYYDDPDTGAETYAVVDGSFIAAALCAYRDSFVYPATTLLNKTIPGLELYDEDYDDYYSELQLTLCGGSSVFLVESVGGAMKVVDDLTTDNTTVERNNINIITAKDYIAKDIAAQLDRTFIGRLIKDPGSYVNTVIAYMKSIFTAYKSASVIASIGTITANITEGNNTSIDIFYSYYSVYAHKLINGTYSLEV